MFLIASVTGPRFAAAEPADGAIADWPHYGGDAGGSRYSPLTQVNKNNVTELVVAWEYHTGDVSDAAGAVAKANLKRPRSSSTARCI